jgi:hypothetical protein
VAAHHDAGAGRRAVHLAAASAQQAHGARRRRDRGRRASLPAFGQNGHPNLLETLVSARFPDRRRPVDQGRTGVLSNARAKVYHLPPTKSSGHGVSIEQMFEIVVPGG